MFKCLQEEEKTVDDTRIRPIHAGSDFKAIEETLKQGLKPSYIQAIEDDDAECLESGLNIESRPPSKKISKKKKNRQAIKEEDTFSNLTKRIFHLACALDAAECCKLLLAPDEFPCVWIDAIEECGRSALHFACLCHSHKCIEVLLKHGANPTLKSKHSLIPLEEALLSTRLLVSWDLFTPAAEIVNRVHSLDLTSIKNVEQKCKDQLLPIASKLAKNLNLVPLIALLLTARNSLVTTIIKNLDSDGDSDGTLIDLLVGRVLSFAHANEEYKAAILHPGVTREPDNFHKKSLCADVAMCRRESLIKTKPELKGGSATEIMHGRDREEKIFSEHRNADNDNRDNSCTVNRLKKQVEYVGQVEKNENSFSNNSCDTSEYQLALKVMECVLLCTPRLSGNPQSSYLPPLLRAAQANEEMLISLLLSQAPVNETDGDGNTALHWSLRQATPTNKRSVNIRIVEKLLEAGASVTLGNKLGATPVHTAAGHGHFEALLTILQRDSTGVNVLAATKETPLHYSVKNNHLICTALLLKYGANRNVMNLKNQKPLHLASSQEMHALLSVDDDTVKEQSWQSLIASVTLNAQQWSSDYGTSQNIFLSTSYLQEMDPPRVLPQVHMQTGSEPRNTSKWQFTKSPRTSSLKSSTAAGGDNSDGLQSTLKLPGYKTTLCRFFGTSDGCGWGNKCHFAHSLEEMQFWTSQAFGGLDANNHLAIPQNCGTSNLLCPSTGSPATSSVSGDNEEPNKVFVGGLPPFTTPEDLREVFEEEFGIVKNAVIILGSDKEGIVRSRGFGFVSFEHKKDADEAVSRHFLPVQGKKVEVKRATYRPGEEPYKASVPVSGCWPPAPNSVAGASQVSFFDDALQPSSPSLSSVGSSQSQWPSNVPLSGTVCGEIGRTVAQARENVGQPDLVRLHTQAALEEERFNNNNDYCTPDWRPFPQNEQQNGNNYDQVFESHGGQSLHADISYPSFFSNYDASVCSPASSYVKDGKFIDNTVPNPLSKTSSSFSGQHISQTKICTPEDEEREFLDLLALLQVTPSKSQRKSSHQLHHMGISDCHNDCQSHYNQIRSRPFQYDFQRPGLQTNQQYVSPVQWASL